MEREAELALVEGLRGDDVAAFEQVYDVFRPRLYGFLLRLSGRHDVAEDLLEETWMRLVQRAHTLRPDTQLAPWLFTVARNLFWSHCRSRNVEARYLGTIEGAIDLWPTATIPSSPYQETAAHEFEDRVERAMTGLSARDREVLLLVAVDGLTPTEAAVVCGVSPEAMRQRLSRARVQLARLLETTGPGVSPPARGSLP